ncbi:unnamed protein product [Rotaria magnacalcarata]|uniref:Uncharacterized protein n=1 Tax=Rotaria magnacalcarata TaxID=392030 RepID=A0A816WII7_9BILA|nr:unnamed protein product [Rotaria magnacalcarata]CAF2134327.1 unnamed protein product [Rotaria magnacalcarata]CAF4157238.1 unnamed protein product [Rotaria magnacalcarata]CAF4261825.1 unnamed protein product [Rotaria magnacalcarata]
MKAQYILAKTKDDILHIINSEELIIHRDKQKLKIGDEVSWSGKSRNERGRGKVIAVGTQEQCQATKNVIEETSSATKCLSKKESTSAAKQLPTTDSSSMSSVVPRIRPLMCISEDEMSNTTTMANSKPNASSRLISIPSSASSITFTSPPRSTILKKLDEAQMLKASECSNDTSSEPPLVIDEESSVDNTDDLQTNTKVASATPKDTQVSRLGKRSHEEIQEQQASTRKPTKSFRTLPVKKLVSESAHAALLQEKQKLANQVERFKATWMPRPNDPKTINFFIEVGRLLSGEADHDENNNDNENANTLEDCCDELDLDVSELNTFSRSESIKKTCRQIVSKLVPKDARIGFSWKDVPAAQQTAIFDLARLLNPAERRKPDSELARACRNVFEVANSLSRKLGPAENKSEENDTGDND